MDMDGLWEWVSVVADTRRVVSEGVGEVVGGVAGRWVPEVGVCWELLLHRDGMVWGEGREGGRLIGGSGGAQV